MSRARLLLHGAALLVPLLIILLRSPANMLAAVPIVGIAGIIGINGVIAVGAAQLACFIYWPWIERRAQRNASGWPIGIVLAGACHVLFSVGLLLPGMTSMHAFGEALGMSVLVLGFSLIFEGWLSFPLSMVVAQWVVNLRARELHHVAA